jgi:hypothetical protein
MSERRACIVVAAGAVFDVALAQAVAVGGTGFPHWSLQWSEAEETDMNLTPEHMVTGRRNFLRAIAGVNQPSASTLEISGSCSTARVGTPLLCGPEKASHSASWCIAANESLKSSAPVKIA